MDQRLPAELWRDIFILATSIAGFRDTSHKSPFALPYGNRSSPFTSLVLPSDISLEYARQSISTKAIILRVSKMWYFIGRELLFEFICIKHKTQLQGFVSSLRATPSLGPLVRRIDICFSGTLPRIGDDLITAMFKRCPNVEIFIDRTFWDIPTNFPSVSLHQLAQRSNQQLRYFAYRLGKGPRMSVLAGCSERLHALEILSLTSIYCSRDEEVLVTPPLSFPRLHTLILNPSSEWARGLPTLASWDIPSLRHVKCFRRGMNVNWKPFFRTHGGKIKVLELPADHELNETINLCASSLEELMITSFPSTPPLTLPSMPHFKYLGIQNDEISESKFVRVFHKIFLQLVDQNERRSLPMLERVRFIRFSPEFPMTDWAPKDVDRWNYFEEKLEMSGVRIEGGKGEKLQLPDKMHGSGIEDQSKREAAMMDFRPAPTFA